MCVDWAAVVLCECGLGCCGVVCVCVDWAAVVLCVCGLGCCGVV